MIIAFLIGIILICIFFPFLRSIILHIPATVYSIGYDIYHYYHDRQWRIPPFGFIDMYCGLFGQGKTVSAVARVRSIYRRYNNKKVFIDGQWRRVQIRIFSNVELQGVPYEKLTSLQQIVDWRLVKLEHPEAFAYFVIDECSSILNSRSFASNMNFFSINSFLTCRHSNAAVICTSQRFAMVDKILREVTQTVYQCKKTWRVITQGVYDAYVIENASDPTQIKPRGFRTLFCKNTLFRTYDTQALVDQINKSCKESDQLGTSEILEKIGQTDSRIIPDRDRLRRFRDK